MRACVCVYKFKSYKIPTDYWPHFTNEENEVLTDLATEMECIKMASVGDVMTVDFSNFFNIPKQLV